MNRTKLASYKYSMITLFIFDSLFTTTKVEIDSLEKLFHKPLFIQSLYMSNYILVVLFSSAGVK